MLLLLLLLWCSICLAHNSIISFCIHRAWHRVSLPTPNTEKWLCRLICPPGSPCHAVEYLFASGEVVCGGHDIQCDPLLPTSVNNQNGELNGNLRQNLWRCCRFCCCCVHVDCKNGFLLKGKLRSYRKKEIYELWEHFCCNVSIRF